MASGRGRRSVRLTPRGKGFLAVGIISFVAAYLLSTPELRLLTGFATLLPIAAALLVRFRRIDLEVSRSFDPPVVAASEQTVVELVIANASPVPVPALAWQDAASWRSGGGTAAAGVIRPLSARRSHLLDSENVVRVRYAAVPPLRGISLVGPLSVMLEDPFGLAQAFVSVGGTDRLVVAPAIAMLPDTGIAILQSEGTSILVSKTAGGEDDLSTREYRRGDALRRVHWRASARHGELMVRQEEPRTHAEARVVLDTRRSGYADSDISSGSSSWGGSSSRRSDEEESASFELAVSLAASIALHLSRTGFDVEFVETGHPQLAPVSPSAPFVTTLATLRLSDQRGEHEGGTALAESARIDGSRGSVFAVLSDVDAATLDRLVAQRTSYTLAAAFVIAPRHHAVAERLRLAGWTTVVLRHDDTVDGAWRALAEEHGTRSDGTDIYSPSAHGPGASSADLRSADLYSTHLPSGAPYGADTSRPDRVY